MASLMTIGSEVIGECVEEIWVNLRLKKDEALYTLSCIFCGWISWLDG